MAEASPEEARLARGPEAGLPHSPEASTVEVHHHPLGGIEGEGIGVLDALQKPPELGAQEGRACVRSVDVEPQPLSGTWGEKRCLAGRQDRGKGHGAGAGAAQDGKGGASEGKIHGATAGLLLSPARGSTG